MCLELLNRFENEIGQYLAGALLDNVEEHLDGVLDVHVALGQTRLELVRGERVFPPYCQRELVARSNL